MHDAARGPSPKHEAGQIHGATLSAGYASSGYRAYVLGALVLAYTLNVLDRVLVSILNEPIRQAFSLNDLQMGLLGGPSFAILYTIVGLPIARLAESFDRRAIIASCLIIWSTMTVLCGLAGWLHPVAHVAVFLAALSPVALAFLKQRLWAGFFFVAAAAAISVAALPVFAQYGMLAFGLLLISRIGVGIGEAGCIPTANSVLADYFPPERRATALSIFSLGAPLGAICAAVGGAWLAQQFGWRMAFLALGLPGVAIGLLILATVREPPRETSQTPPPFAEVVRLLASSSTFRHLVTGAAIASFVAYGTGQFIFAFFSRTHGLSPMEAAFYFVIVAGLASAAGTFLGGYLGDRLTGRIPRALVLIPGIGLILSAPLYVLAFMAPSPALLLLALAPAALLHYAYIGPTFAVTQGLVHPRMRATAIAILAFVIALIGYGLGPPLVGLLSDLATSWAFAQATGDTFAVACTGAATVIAACETARADGLQLALIVSVLGYGWAGLHFLLAARRLRAEMV